MAQRTRHAREQQRARQARIRRGLLIGGVALVVAVVGVVVIAAVLDDGGSDGPAVDSAGATTVSMTDFAFSPDPIVLSLAAGARLEVVNDGTTAHDLLIVELGKGTPDLPPGERMTLDLSDQPAGTYRVVCDLPGHTEAGMVTELTLE